MRYIRFYTKDEKGEFAFLSNDFVRRFKIEGKTFYSVHQYLSWRRAIIAGDIRLANKIYFSKTIEEVSLYDSQLFIPKDAYMQEILGTDEFCAVYCKFKSNADIMNKFKELSIDTVFALCGKRDFTSGIGLDYNDKRRDNMRFWVGDNTSGKILSSVRHCLEEV